MKCPFCSHENIEGADQCAGCQADLAGANPGEGKLSIERDLLKRPLAGLLAHDYLEVSPDASVGDVIRRLNEGGFHCAVIVENDVPVGMFTERDVLAKLADAMAAHAGAPVRDFMTPDPETLDHDVSMAFGLNRMMVRGCRHIPILRDGTLAGMVSVRDVLRYLVDRLDERAPASSTA